MSCSRTHSSMPFGDKDPGSRELFSFNFTDRLRSGETITSIESFIVGPGSDDMLSGSPILSGTIASQLIIGGLDGSTYHLTMWADTSLGQRLPLCGDIKVVDPSRRRSRD